MFTFKIELNLQVHLFDIFGRENFKYFEYLCSLLPINIVSNLKLLENVMGDDGNVYYSHPSNIKAYGRSLRKSGGGKFYI